MVTGMTRYVSYMFVTDTGSAHGLPSPVVEPGTPLLLTGWADDSVSATLRTVADKSGVAVCSPPICFPIEPYKDRPANRPFLKRAAIGLYCQP